jgi:hypothetical protein
VNIPMNSQNRVSFRQLPNPNEQSSRNFTVNEFLPLVFSRSPNGFSRFSVFSTFSLRHHRVFNHFVPLRLSASRLLFGLQENTENFDFPNEILFRWDARFPLKRKFVFVETFGSIRFWSVSFRSSVIWSYVSIRKEDTEMQRIDKH